jgi:hypothetical protein
VSTELRLTCLECGGVSPRPLPYSMVEPDQCDHCHGWFRTKFEINLWEIKHEIKQIRQSKLGSFIEACANTAVGYCIAVVCMRIIMWAYDFPMGTRETSIVVGWMTVVSVLRGYAIRRMWNSQFWKRKRHGN